MQWNIVTEENLTSSRNSLVPSDLINIFQSEYSSDRFELSGKVIIDTVQKINRFDLDPLQRCSNYPFTRCQPSTDDDDIAGDGNQLRKYTRVHCFRD